MLVDLNLVTESDRSLVIDKSKIRRERNKLRTQLQMNSTRNGIDVSSIYFDGRKDNTLKKIKDGDKWYSETQ